MEFPQFMKDAVTFAVVIIIDITKTTSFSKLINTRQMEFPLANYILIETLSFLIKTA